MALGIQNWEYAIVATTEGIGNGLQKGVSRETAVATSDVLLLADGHKSIVGRG